MANKANRATGEQGYQGRMAIDVLSTQSLDALYGPVAFMPLIALNALFALIDL